ncbi:APC family permease [Maricaulis alexandrii]|uniref:APC family permease n=1 Tax=Maricaulis alexandrii TaxID=2570354 RepID=UPI001107A7B3|nr:APC family permease [Maricaulis alexandrii]
MSELRELKQGVGLLPVVALGLGTAIGVSIFSVIAPATELAGPAMLLAVPLAAIPMFVIAVTYAFMGSTLPTSGASYEWPRRFVSEKLAFAIVWLRIAGNVGAMFILSLVLVRYLSFLIPLPTKAAMAGLFVIVFGLNFFGVALAASIQTVLMVALLIFFGIFSFAGVPAVDPAAFTPFLSQGWGGVLATIPLLVGLFFGIEAATEVGGEVRNSRRNIPLGIAVAITTSVVVYLLVAGVCLGLLGPQGLGASETPVLDAVAVLIGEERARPVVALAAIAAIGTSLNALCMTFSRSFYAMGRAGALPEVFGRVHSKFGTPHYALAAAFTACMVGLLFPVNLAALFLAVNIPVLLKFCTTCLSAIRIVRTRPDLHEQAGFKLSSKAVQVWAVLGIIMAITVTLLGISTDWRPYLILAGWGLVGAIVYIIRHRNKPAAGQEPAS